MLCQLHDGDSILRHARVAGGDEHLLDAGTFEKRVGDGVFACTGPDDQNLETHGVVCLSSGYGKSRHLV